MSKMITSPFVRHFYYRKFHTKIEKINDTDTITVYRHWESPPDFPC